MASIERSGSARSAGPARATRLRHASEGGAEASTPPKPWRRSRVWTAFLNSIGN